MAPRNLRRRLKRAEKPYARQEGKAELQEDSCIFCEQPNKNDGCDEMLSGERPNGGKFHVHYFCLLFSSGLQQGGDESGPLRGFQEADIMKELKRGTKLKCSYCKQRNATVGCCLKLCKKMFHVCCASANKCLLQFYDDFRAYCPEHRLLQRMTPKETGKAVCLICSCDLVPEPSPDVLVTPCCKYSFHKDCLQAQASNAGSHFFKCSTCNNREAFQKEMLDHGIFIPERDASWELEQGAFQELLFRYQQCDAVRCRCTHGRKFSVEQQGDDWEVMPCSTCGSQGIHRACGNLSRGATQRNNSGGNGEQSNSWNCPGCRPFVKSKNSAAPAWTTLSSPLKRKQDMPSTSSETAEATAVQTVTEPVEKGTEPCSLEQASETKRHFPDEIQKPPAVLLPRSPSPTVDEPSTCLAASFGSSVDDDDSDIEVVEIIQRVGQPMSPIVISDDEDDDCEFCESRCPSCCDGEFELPLEPGTLQFKETDNTSLLEIRPENS